MKDFPFAICSGSSRLYVEIREVCGVTCLRKQQELLLTLEYQPTSGQFTRLWFPKEGFGQSLVFKMTLVLLDYLLYQDRMWLL